MRLSLRRLGHIIGLAVLLQPIALYAQNVGARIATQWTDKVDTAAVLNEYPRPQLVRSDWINLNGKWDYAILPVSAEAIPTAFQGKILVPFAVESFLSGVGRTVGKDSVLWYSRSFATPNLKDKQLLLNFGAVDWHAIVFVNGQKIGEHKGGYDPFSFDITPYLKKGKQQQLSIRVWDPTDDGPQPRGKQVKKPQSIWYTAVTGIWQTVWLEPVSKTHIASTKQTPDLDNRRLSVSAEVTGLQPGDQVKVSAWDGTALVSEQTLTDGNAVLPVANPKTWSPKSPFLYDLKYSVVRKGKTVDEAKSYFAMRKISVAPDQAGVQRMLLNNEFVFQYGPLDQGWWPDGLYTAPTDDALKSDIERTREMGFNLIRKHTKVEPARWYYWCDKLGVMVWQDMPTGDLGGNGRWESRPGYENANVDKKRSPESESIYRAEWAEIMKDLYNFPSIIVWVPFNEGWGQFKTAEITEWTMHNDPSRLVNSASGGNFHSVGHIIDLHNYPEPAMPSPELFGKQVIVLGEFGGLGYPIEGHTWQDKNNWGYQNFKNADTLLTRYSSFIDRLEYYIGRGLSAAIYTQTTDVEGEVNGLMTYDRRLFKMPPEKMRELHAKLYNKSVRLATP